MNARVRLALRREGAEILISVVDDGAGLDYRAIRAAAGKRGLLSADAPATDAQLADLLFAWRVAKFVKSNAIVYAKDLHTIGVGAGQMSRVYSARIAGIKADDADLVVPGSVMASDAFFPFRDGIDAAAQAGISHRAVGHPRALQACDRFGHPGHPHAGRHQVDDGLHLDGLLPDVRRGTVGAVGRQNAVEQRWRDHPGKDH